MERNTKKIETWFFILLFLAVCALTILLFKPYLILFAVTASLAVALQPLYQRLQIFFGRTHVSIAAFTTVLVLIVGVLFPLGLFGTLAVREASHVYTKLVIGMSGGPAENLIPWIEEKLHTLLPFANIDVREGLQAALRWFVQHIGPLFAGALSTLLLLILGLMTLYYFLKHGPTLAQKITLISPLADTHDAYILSTLQRTVTSVLRGSVTIALIQGILTAIGLAIFGVPNAALWGSLAAIAALIPGLGTALVLLPSIVYLFVTGHSAAGIGLLIWGVVAVGLIDNVLGPSLMGRGVRVHPFIILLSVLGGLQLFGAAGFLLGPVVVSLLLALWEVYSRMDQQK